MHFATVWINIALGAWVVSELHIGEREEPLTRLAYLVGFIDDFGISSPFCENFW
jgi:hypothetical protein